MRVSARLSSALLLLLLGSSAMAQDASTGAIRGLVIDPSDSVIPGARVTVTQEATGTARAVLTDASGHFAVTLLRPGIYSLRTEAKGMASQVRSGARVEVGGNLFFEIRLEPAGPQETVTVTASPVLLDTRSSALSTVIGEDEVEDLPLNGRRFQDLTLLVPGASEDPRGLTSSSNGDLSFGGVRGYHTNFLVDGSDNNNGFFAQARGRYRAPYQFSSEVIQEYRVSSNTYGAELGRSAGAVVNVVTKSGSNHLRGTLFYYLRHHRFNAQHPFLDFKPPDRQHQFGFTLGGRFKQNRAFFYGGWDQHLFYVPTVVRFADGSSEVVPGPDDYEFNDRDLVFAEAAALSQQAGSFESRLIGNAAFLKFDFVLTPQHYLSTRLATSRYSGENNVFFDPSSPVTNFAVSDNGEEIVSTESVSASLASALSFRLTSNLRVQYSRDLQRSVANSPDVRTQVDEIIEGFGRSSILPRRTHEHRLHVAETLGIEGGRHSWKIGSDFMRTTATNFFPLLFGGQYIFDEIRVNPFFFVPQTFGLRLTPLRAWAHRVPRFYLQNFGDSISHPGSNDYALFVQDSIRVSDHFALNLGLRYDRQTFSTEGLESNPLWPDSGKVPSDTNNIAPRVGFALSFGEENPIVFRGGYGIFYTRIPQIYNSAVENENGLRRGHLFLDNRDFFDQQLFPAYPAPLVDCPPSATECFAPTNIVSRLESDLSAFSPDFQTPYVHQASLSAEKEVLDRLAIGVSFLYTRGRHLVRSRDVNLPEPVEVSYPVFDDSDEFTGDFFNVASFSDWELQPSLTCPFPPCVAPLDRPIPQVGAINVFESAASSEYKAMTVSVRRRMTRGVYFRLSYTLARATDDGQDALITGRSGNVQNSFAPEEEQSRSVTDQRHRLAFSWVTLPQPFHRDHPHLKRLFNDWKFSGVVTVGSGRPVNARVIGDPNRDGNTFNDRLPGFSRNAFTGPDYATVNLRLSRRLYLGRRFRLDLMVEAFNTFNRNNKRVDISDDGFINTAGDFVPFSTVVGGIRYPAHFRRSSGFLRPVNAYAPRQVQLALRLGF